MISIGIALDVNVLGADSAFASPIPGKLQYVREDTAMDGMKTFLLLTIFFLVACAPEVGSKAWCEDMKKKPKGDWTATEATDFAKHCLLELGE